MKYVLCSAFAVLAVIVVVHATRCQHGDLTDCMAELSCNNDTGKVVGCEHDLCTCVVPPESCLQKTDCVTTHCKHGESVHCDNSACICAKDPAAGHG